MKKNNLTKLLVLVLAVCIAVFAIVKLLPGKDDPSRGFGSFYSGSTYTSSWTLSDNTKKLNTSVASGSRSKYTRILGNGKDVYTILVYMCGSDLESRSSMGSYDLQEMANATIGKNVNLLVYTGGTTKWHISGISTKVNQIYRIVGGGQIERVVENAGTSTMVNPDVLESFIEWGVQNYPANRYGLIFWDHGSGSLGGYGYDEKYPNNQPMSYGQIDQALTDADTKFDFIGFDACLMATLENGLMLAEHADYLIASEESEPGIGWYYTNWLTKLSANTSMATIELGKNIADDFVSTSAKQVPNQAATLSVIDLAELANTVPSKLAAFGQSTNDLLENSGYRTIASARSGSREFATSQGVDLVDLADLASRMNTSEGKALTQALLSAVKYNNTSSNMANSYGISIYFPYRSTKYINNVLKNYNEIDMDADYTSCIRNFASYQVSGQVSSSQSSNSYSTNNPYASLIGQYSTDSYSSQSSGDMVMTLLNMFLGADSSSSSSSSNPMGSLLGYGLQALFGGRDNLNNIAQYIADNHFDADLNWKNGKIALTEKQWENVERLALNAYQDNGEGYIELGCDNVFDIDDKGNLKAPEEKTWLALSSDNKNWTVIPYYYMYTVEGENDSYQIYGRVPVMLNGDRAELILVFSDEKPEGQVAGVTYCYDETFAVAKNLSELAVGDKLDFICDFYSYDGEYTASRYMNDTFTVGENIYIGDIDISDYNLLMTYQFTDIYQQNYWSAPIK